jgi:hypothetical protein
MNAKMVAGSLPVELALFDLKDVAADQLLLG